MGGVGAVTVLSDASFFGISGSKCGADCASVVLVSRTNASVARPVAARTSPTNVTNEGPWLRGPG